MIKLIMTVLRDLRSALAIGVVIVLMTGCGQESGSGSGVSGKVTLDNQPLEQGQITFYPDQGTSSGPAAGKIEKGEYSIAAKDGPLPGKYKVKISSMRPSSKMVPKPFGAPGEMVAAQEEAVATQYNSATTLSIDVKSGDNTANYDVKSK